MTAAGLHERLLHLNAIGAPPYDRQQAFVDWFRASLAEGNPPDRLRRDAPTWSERFDAQVIDGLDGCLIWDGPTEARASGRVPVLRRGKSKKNARLFAMQRAGITVPAWRRVVPTCGSSRCVRVEHLAIESGNWSERWTRDDMIRRLQVMALRLGFTPNRRCWDTERGKPSSPTFLREFDSWDDAVRAAGLPQAKRERANQYAGKDWPGACRIGLRALARRLNRTPSTRDIERERDWLAERGHPIAPATYYRYLSPDRGTWADVLASVGLSKNPPPLDEARAMQRLVAAGLSQRQIAARVGCSQSHVAKQLARLPWAERRPNGLA